MNAGIPIDLPTTTMNSMKTSDFNHPPMNQRLPIKGTAATIPQSGQPYNPNAKKVFCCVVAIVY